jgi:lipopolysaccharide transport system ATP-binding protein
VCSSDLFRFCTNKLHPEGKHIIYEINLFSGLPNSHDSSVVAKINVGSPMDNNSSLPNYVIDNRKTTDWTGVIRDEEIFYRCYANVGGKDCHAPFVLSVPNYILQENQDKKLYLEVKHSNSKEELIYLEYFDTSEYKFIGELNQSVPNSFYSSVFEIPFILESDKQEKTLSTSQEQIQIHAIQQKDEKPLIDNEGNKECVLLSVEFLLKSGKSTKVVPIGEYLKVDIYYEAYSSILDPVFAITIHGIDGNQMDHKNNKLLGKNIKEINGKGKASFVFNPFRLGTGEYNVSVAILKYLSLEDWHDVPPCYDRHDRQYSLFVSTESKNLGMVVQESEFELISNL